MKHPATPIDLTVSFLKEFGVDLMGLANNLLDDYILSSHETLSVSLHFSFFFSIFRSLILPGWRDLNCNDARPPDFLYDSAKAHVLGNEIPTQRLNLSGLDRLDSSYDLRPLTSFSPSRSPYCILIDFSTSHPRYHRRLVWDFVIGCCDPSAICLLNWILYLYQLLEPHHFCCCFFTYYQLPPTCRSPPICRVGTRLCGTWISLLHRYLIWF